MNLPFLLHWRIAMTLPYAEDPTRLSADRVRRSTSEGRNRQIDRQTDNGIARYSRASPGESRKRIADLDREWYLERMLEVNASTLALTGLVLGLTVNRKWFVLPGNVLPFLLQHGLQGRCPPLPLLRQMGARTRGEMTVKNTHCRMRCKAPDAFTVLSIGARHDLSPVI
jgi:hypothetical protein